MQQTELTKACEDSWHDLYVMHNANDVREHDVNVSSILV
jgi:hypothetical protein